VRVGSKKECDDGEEEEKSTKLFFSGVNKQTLMNVG
jgi:hypothetical protein